MSGMNEQSKLPESGVVGQEELRQGVPLDPPNVPFPGPTYGKPVREQEFFHRMPGGGTIYVKPKNDETVVEL